MVWQSSLGKEAGPSAGKSLSFVLDSSYIDGTVHQVDAAAEIVKSRKEEKYTPT